MVGRPGSQTGELVTPGFEAENIREYLVLAERRLDLPPGPWCNSPDQISVCESAQVGAGSRRCRLGVPTLARTERLTGVGVGAKAGS